LGSGYIGGKIPETGHGEPDGVHGPGIGEDGGSVNVTM
jgi:hypothetical protein